MILPKESATFFKLPIQLFKGVSYPELALFTNFVKNYIYDMKNLRITLAIICALFLCANAWSQDLTFMGVSLESSPDEICSQLKDRGFTYIRKDNYNTHHLEGEFWKFGKCEISVWGENEPRVSVKPPSWTTVSTMRDLINSLDNKYGINDSSQSDDFKTELRWDVGENSITLLDFYIDGHNYSLVYASKAATVSSSKNRKNFSDDL